MNAGSREVRIVPAAHRRRLARWLIHATALTALAMCLAVFAYDTLNGWPGGLYQFTLTLANASVGLAYAGVGWLLASRRPGNVVGVLLLASGVLWLAFGPVDVYLTQLPRRGAVPPLADFAATFVYTIGIPLSVLGSLALVVFPDGRTLSRRWSIAAAIAVVFAAVGVAGVWLGSASFAPIYPKLGSPFAIEGFPVDAVSEVTDKTLMFLSILGIAAVGMRWLRGTRVERAQVKWIAAAGLISFLTARIAIAFGATFDTAQVVTNVMASIGSALVPIAIGVAIMRYRLYEIDRIVSRTVSYGLLTAALVAVFAIVNLATATLLSPLLPVLGGTTGVAAATLAAAALFNPVRRRAQGLVDRRFNRSHHDAQRVVESFNARLRTEVDLGVLSVALRRTAADAVEPSTTALWLKRRHR